MAKDIQQVSEFEIMKEGNEYKYYEMGEWKVSRSKQTVSITNPYDGTIVGRVQACTKDEVDNIVNTAKENIEC